MGHGNGVKDVKLTRPVVGWSLGKSVSHSKSALARL